MKYFFAAVCVFTLFSCTDDNQKPGEAVVESKETKDEFYHYSIWTALVNKIYDANFTVKEAKAHGDIGLGTYNGADEELIMIDNVFYHRPIV